MKKILITLLSLLVICVPAIATETNDYFFSLENLKIGETLSNEIITKTDKTIKQNAETIYTFSSELSSNPHIIYTNQLGKISFIQLTIPKKQRSYYLNILQNLGDPETTLPKTKSEILMSYPSQGLAFVINGYSNNILRIMKFPSKTAQEFTQAEGKNFQPVPFTPETTSATTSVSAILVTKNPSKSILNWYIILFTCFILFVLITFSWWIKKKRNKIEEKQISV